MENKDTKTHYQEVCCGRGPKVRNGRNYNWNRFFVYDSYSLTSIYTGNFQVPPEKNHPNPNFQFPPKIPIWPKFLLYEPSENGSAPSTLPPPPPLSPRGDANYDILMDRSMYIFNCNKTVEAWNHNEIFIRLSLNNCFFVITRPTP